MIILDSIKSNTLRHKYIKEFVDTSLTYYKKNIERKIMFCDGLCYIGYLWDCLINPSIISEQKADQLLQEKRDFYIMWDIHSCERILIPDYWKFPKTRILCADAWLETLKNDLPEDIYIFDDTFSWSIIYTHETNAKKSRYCLFIDKISENTPNKTAYW